MAIKQMVIASGTPILDALKSMAGEKGRFYWQVTHYKGETTVQWELTERRTTHIGIFLDNKQAIERANDELAQAARQFKAAVKSARYCTQESCEASDELREQNEGTAYSEYETAVGSSVVFNDNEGAKIVAPTPKPVAPPTPVAPPAGVTAPAPSSSYVNSIPDVTRHVKNSPVLVPFLNALHKLHPDIVWTGTLWPAEKTQTMVSAGVTPEQISKLRRATPNLKWKASSYKGKTFGKRWFVAEHNFPNVLQEDTNFSYRVALGVPSNGMSTSVALRVLVYRKNP